VTRLALDERFPAETLDDDVWFPYYLPHWSSREAAAASYAVRDGELRLSIPVDQTLWCADLHPEPLRVSVIQSGSLAGPLGSTQGQQPFREGLRVREEQPTLLGYTPRYGHIEARMRGVVTERSMFALWLSGIEDEPAHSGEICVAEIFGSGVRDGTAEVGLGIHRFRDPRSEEAFSVLSLPVDVSESHTFAVDWRAASVTFSVDGQSVHRIEQAPDYPMQLMLGVFDFPDRAADPEAVAPVPEMVVSYISGTPLD